VSVFFIISGYLISGILLRAREQVVAGRQSPGAALRRFFVRRVLRIMPVYYASIAAMLVVGLEGLRESVGWLLTYTTNFGMVCAGVEFKHASHFWSLAVEEQFYLVWPLLLLWLPVCRLRLVIGIVLAGSLGFCLIAGAAGASLDALMRLPIGGASLALGFGALLAYGKVHPNELPGRAFRVAWGVGALLFVVSQILWWQRAHLPALSEFAGRMLFPWAVTPFFAWLFLRSLRRGHWLNGLLSLRPLRYVGRISYGIYVYHFLLDPYFHAIWARLGLRVSLDPVAEGFLKTATSIVIAALSWHCFEKPILSLKDRWAPEPRA